MMGSNDVKRAVKETLVMVTCYSLYLILFVLLLVKLWIKIK
jgi:hypothetical protein